MQRNPQGSVSEKAPLAERLALSVDDFARHAGISRATVWRRIAAGDVRTMKLGPRTMIPMDEVRRIFGAPVAPIAAWGRGHV